MRFQFDSDTEKGIWGAGFFIIAGVGTLLRLPEITVVAVFWLFLGKRSSKLFIWIAKKTVSLIRDLKN